jgi:hypothetical protein
MSLPPKTLSGATCSSELPPDWAPQSRCRKRLLGLLDARCAVNGLAVGGPRLLFKGGTLAFQGLGLISRFSEDIDITVFRDDLGRQPMWRS